MATAKIVPNKSDDVNREAQVFPPACESILYLDSNYCVVDKPHKVRMTGDFSITMEKLLLHWIPGIQIGSLKWIHQLDFATSGVLCVGLNRAAAAVASAAFEARTVKKQYLAVLQGHVNLDDWPILEARPAFGDEDEADDISIPGKRKHEKIEGNTPAVESNTTWQAEVKEANLSVYFDAFTSWKAAHCDPPLADSEAANVNSKPSFTEFQHQHPDRYKLLVPLLAQTYETFLKQSKQRKALRKFLKSYGIEVETQVSELAARPDLVAQMEKAKEELAANTVTNFEVTQEAISAMSEEYKNPSDVPRVYRVRGAEHRLVINVPVAEILGDFRMEPGHEGNPGKHCETEMEVLEHGTYQGRAVTKVRFYPRSGRRHQLRVHSMCLGHPIVGDYTYNPLHRDAVQAENNAIRDNLVNNEGAEVLAADRMMLHAHYLRVNYPIRKDLRLPDPASNTAMNELIRPVLSSLTLKPCRESNRTDANTAIPLVEVAARGSSNLLWTR
eukprot:gene16374-18684_t